jgi:catechol 2,3-dioxygenase-like lactoylglutathione lyase family enzyme
MRDPKPERDKLRPPNWEYPMVRTRGLYHIHLVVRDLERALRFYQGVFGLEEKFRAGPKMVFLTTPGAHDLITLNEDAAESEHAGEHGGIAHFGFQLADAGDLDAAIAEVEAAGGRLLRRGEHGPGAPFAYVADPDGYEIEL